MNNTKILVVDDSTFSRSIIADALIEGGFEVVGGAGGLEEAIEQYRQYRPDIVTMDLVMPGADGLECIRALKIEDPNVKVVIVSSMKDDELIQEAKKLHVLGYVQKPVDNEVLISAIRSAVAPDKVYESLNNLYLDAFQEAFASGITMITKTAVEFETKEASAEMQYTSLGVAVVIGIIGRYSGRVIFDLSPVSAEEMTKATLQRDPKNPGEVQDLMAEFANIFCGNACSMLNKKVKEFGLRITPPSIFYGTSAEIVSPNIEKKAVYAETVFGRMYLNIGFKRGMASWT